jgi:hypothetical protein
MQRRVSFYQFQMRICFHDVGQPDLALVSVVLIPALIGLSMDDELGVFRSENLSMF